MRSYVEWLDQRGFFLNRRWDNEAQEFVHESGKLILWPHMRRIMGHAFTINPKTGRFPYRTFVLSAPKKSGKTAWSASLGSWGLEESYGGTEIYSLANDQEEAESLSMRAIKFNYQERNRQLLEAVRSGEIDAPDAQAQIYKLEKYRILAPNTSFIQCLSGDYASSAGRQQALTLWDELWAYKTESSRRLWEEMTLLPTEKFGMRVVVTYAGFEGESETLWNLYEQTVVNGRRLYEEFPDLPCYTNELGTIFCYWDHEPRMPWQTPEYYEAEMAELRPVQFRRLHLNEWGAAEDEFIPIELWDVAAKRLEVSLPYETDSPRTSFPISIGVDVGVKRDSTGVVGVYSYHDVDGGGLRVGIAFHRVWKPARGFPVDPAVVEEYIREMYKKYTVVSIVCDPAHFYQNIMSMERDGLPIREFKQTTGNMVSASTALYEVLRMKRLDAYPDDDLREHIRFAAAKVQGSGFRIVKKEGAAKPVDAAIAAAMAIYDAIERGGVDTSKPQYISSYESEHTGFNQEQRLRPEEEKWPEQLRGTTSEDRSRALEEHKRRLKIVGPVAGE